MKKLLLLLLAITMAYTSCKPGHPGTQQVPVPYYAKALTFLDRQNDSAFFYFNKTVNASKDGLQIAEAYNYMSYVQMGAGDYFGGQETLLQSLKYLDTAKTKDKSCLASDYNMLGLTSIRLKNYEAAIPYFDQAIKFTTIPSYRLIFLNNKALAYQEHGNYVPALHIYREVIGQVKDSATYARVLTNLATTKWLQHTTYNAAPELYKALAIRLRNKDRWGENSSYRHMADYYTHSHPDSALFYANQMYAVARQLQSPDDQLTALKILSDVSPAARSKTYFATYIALNDSVQSARNAAKNQFALIRYNSEKNKADALRLEKDNTVARYQIIRQQVVIGGIILLIIVLSVLVLLWMKKRKRQQLLATQNAVRDTQQKASKKVHDTLANDIYVVMKKVQRDPVVNQDWLVRDMSDVYNRARDLSYDIQPDVQQNFKERITGLLTSFGTDETAVSLVGNSEALWAKISPDVKWELKYILQELMVNMQKHSRAHNVVVRFEDLGEQCLITYADDGVGVKNGTVFNNGLTGTGNRINRINGVFIFDSSPEKGLEIQIMFPIA